MGIFKLNGIDYMGGGEGGNANEQVLTWDEYCALTEEEKTNGTTYYINDINGVGKDQFQPIIYSEEEREVGVWIDGKPLYEKTVTFTNISRTGVIDLDLINIDNIFVHDGKYAQYLPLPYVHYDMGNGIGGFFETDSNGKWIWNVRGGSYVSSVTGWITVRYTKTTDQPGSGTWTPQGVPAVHYSTDEQVVGTWIDGSTIYEKTYEVTGINADNNYVIDANFTQSAIKLLPGCSAVLRTTGTYNTDFSLDVLDDNSAGIRLFTNVNGLNFNVAKYNSHSSHYGTCSAVVTIRYTKSTS